MARKPLDLPPDEATLAKIIWVVCVVVLVLNAVLVGIALLVLP
jgi:hypothetical protein